MLKSINEIVTYLGHEYVFSEVLTSIHVDNNSRHIVTIIDDSYHSDILTGIIEGHNFIAFYSYDYYIFFDKTSNIFSLTLKKAWNLVRQLYEALPLINYILWQEKSILLHAAAVEIDSNAYLFLGESGAGKTTISKLAYDRNIQVLGDEMVVLQIDNKPVVWGTHVHSNDYHFWDKNVVSQPFPLMACFVLNKSERSKIRKIDSINKVDLFNKFVREYIYKIYRVEELLFLINKTEFYFLDFEKEKFEFELLYAMGEDKKQTCLNQILSKKPCYFGELIRVLNEHNNDEINIVEVKKEKLYFVETCKEFHGIKMKGCFLVGTIDSIDCEDLKSYIPEKCSFISYTPVNHVQYMGRKKLFGLEKKVNSAECTNRRPQRLKDQKYVSCMKEMIASEVSDGCPEYEQYIVEQLMGMNSDILAMFDFWGIYDNGDLISLVRVDNELHTNELIIRSIGLVYTKKQYRNKGYASDLILQLLTIYSDDKTIWRYEAEADNTPSIDLAKKVGFKYEGDTFYYEYPSSN